MALTPERTGQIALLILQEKMLKEGINLQPKEVRRDVINNANKFGVSFSEMADFYRFILNIAYQRTMQELGMLPSSGPIEIS